MAITSNVDLVNTYDNDQQIVSTRILPNEAPDDDEHACQCLAIETLRELLASGITVDEYNAMTNEAWQAVQDAAYDRAKFNVNAPLHTLTQAQRDSAGNVGGNFFEHGYVSLMSGISQADKVSFTRVGGV